MSGIGFGAGIESRLAETSGVALPEFREDGWLPQGHHGATWEEIVVRFSGSPDSQRANVLSRLLAWRDAARAKGIGGHVILDGSFASAKLAPNDFDLILVYDEATETLVRQDAEARELIDNAKCREAGYGDVFAFSARLLRDHPAFCRTDMFDFDRQGRPKGVVEVPL